jgi:hypothetical protein
MGVVRGLPQIGDGVAAGQASAGGGSPAGQDRGPGQWPGPWAAVVASVCWSVWELRAALLPAQYPDDASLHEQMVRFAAARFSAGRDPLTSWFHYLGLGSPQFLHYQSLPAMLTGLAGLVIGPDAAFRWSLYLLWCLWPVAIYASARLLGLARWAAAVAAVVAPLLHSVPGVGYEQQAYAWIGYGLWTQLCGSWALPFAWALSWRAMADRRFLAPAAALVALTAACHYETGYLAFGAVVVMPFLVWAGLRARLLRAAGLLVTSLLASAWVVLPLLLFSRWAGINQALAGTSLVNGYGAGQDLRWLVTGQVFDDGRLPVVSLLAAAGLVVTLLRWRRGGPERALVVLLCGCLLLSFGRATFGGLVAVVPGSTDVFFRRFLMGGQLAGIYLAGLGAAGLGARGGRLAAAGAAFFARRRLAWLPGTALAVAAVACLFPAWRYSGAYDAQNSAAIGSQQYVQQQEQSQVTALVSYLRQHGGGRVYAGSPQGWGQSFTVGYVPMYAYLESQDIDEVGYTLRTASLMTQPEARFDPASPGDYALFGIRYLVLPAATGAAPRPPPGAVLVLRNRQFRVFELPGSTYLRIADTVGTIAAGRADIGSRAARYLWSALPGQDRYLTVAYAGGRPAVPTLRPGARPAGPPGTLLAEHASLASGTASTVVHLRRTAVVVLSASFDPGWSATIDGRQAPVQMVAPALPAVTVPPGTHHITFRYRGFGGYPELFALAAASLLTAAVITRRRSSPPARPARSDIQEKGI